MALNDTVFISVVVAANSHVNFRWSELIFFHPCGGQLMVVPSNFRTSSLSQFRRAGGTRGIELNYNIEGTLLNSIYVSNRLFLRQRLVVMCVTGRYDLSWF